MIIFKGDKLLAGEGPKGYLHSNNICENPPQLIIKTSLELPKVWQDLPPWCEANDRIDFIGAPDGYEWIDLREVARRYGNEAFVYAGTAYQYMNWLREVQFCSNCGEPLSPGTKEKSLVCPECERTFYPPITPAVIVAVERDGKLLLAHNVRMPSKRYSILAGFVEPGESLERTIEREIMEETGIEVEDVRYFGSQPWPFPCSLMIGFTARWKSGEVHPDGTELSDAGWFAPGEFPEIPPPLSISRWLIDDFVKRNSAST